MSPPVSVRQVLINSNRWSVAAERVMARASGGQCGLINLGNTCFMNSCLQALLHCAPLVALFCQYAAAAQRASSAAAPDALSLLHTDDRNAARREVVARFADLCLKSAAGESAAHAPHDMIAAVRAVHRDFRPYEQHDAHEFLRITVDALDEGTKRWLPPVDTAGRPLPPPPPHESEAQRLKREATLPRRSFDSPVKDIFGGRMLSQLQCEQCGYVSSKIDNFSDLLLPIPSRAQAVRARHCHFSFFFFSFLPIRAASRCAGMVTYSDGRLRRM